MYISHKVKIARAYSFFFIISFKKLNRLYYYFKKVRKKRYVHEICLKSPETERVYRAVVMRKEYF